MCCQVWGQQLGRASRAPLLLILGRGGGRGILGWKENASRAQPAKGELGRERWRKEREEGDERVCGRGKALAEVRASALGLSRAKRSVHQEEHIKDRAKIKRVFQEEKSVTRSFL